MSVWEFCKGLELSEPVFRQVFLIENSRLFFSKVFPIALRHLLAVQPGIASGWNIAAVEIVLPKGLVTAFVRGIGCLDAVGFKPVDCVQAVRVA